jgi:multidrug efflux pump subunit AcrA (membrane-fusion protein)
VVAGFLVLVAIAAGWIFRSREQARQSAATSVRTVKAVRGSLAKSRRIAGSIFPGRFANIAAPVLQSPDAGRGLVLIYLADSGKMVKEGEIVARIDAQSVIDHLEDVESNITQAALDIRRRKAQYSAQTEYLQQRVRAAKGELQKALQDARVASLKPEITQEILRLAVSEAEALYDELRAEVPLTDQRQDADLRLYEMAYEAQIRHRNRHKADADHCEIKSPMDGMVVLQTRYRNGQQDQIKLGDELSPGQPFMRIVEPKSLLLDATMNQTESEDIRMGQKAVVRFDAFPDLVLHGHVTAVGAIAMSGRRANYFIRRVTTRIALDDRDARVLPDLTASADITTSDETEGLIVPREAVQLTAGKPIVYVKQTDGLAPREVEIGGMNTTQAAIVAGLESGEEVAVAPPGS